MPDTIVDDVKELLDKEKGDKRILEQILRAAENNEVISNYERNYVKNLAEKHLGRKPIEEVTPTPDVAIEPQQPVQKIETFVQPEPEPVKTSKPVNTKLILGVGVVALAVIVIATISFYDLPTTTPSDEIDVTPIEKPITNSPITIQNDLSSYDKGDIISISGKSDPSFGNQVNLTIENEDGKLVWSENVKVKADGRYSTLAIAGGNGWSTGTFTLTATHGPESISNTFSFNG